MFPTDKRPRHLQRRMWQTFHLYSLDVFHRWVLFWLLCSGGCDIFSGRQSPRWVLSFPTFSWDWLEIYDFALHKYKLTFIFLMVNNASSAVTICCKFMRIPRELKEAITQQYAETEHAIVTEKSEELIFNPLSNMSAEVNDGQPHGSIITGMAPQ